MEIATVKTALLMCSPPNNSELHQLLSALLPLQTSHKPKERLVNDKLNMNEQKEFGWLLAHCSSAADPALF
jgi:hypothetical protein